jgi:hypothetical protein
MQTGVATPSLAEREPPLADVREALGRVIASAVFRASPRLAQLLRFVVEHSLAGEGTRLKGYTIAVEAFGRAPDFDPQIDPIVRVEAGRLRQRLDRYYAGEGAGETVWIELPRGGYEPVFHRREVLACAVLSPVRPDERGDAVDASLRELIGLCQLRLRALTAEVALLESMIAHARAASRHARGGGSSAV